MIQNLLKVRPLPLQQQPFRKLSKGSLLKREARYRVKGLGNPKIWASSRSITVSIDAVLPDTAALSEILYSIETRTPYLIVKELDTRVRNPREPKDLMVKMDISALTGGK